MKIHIDKRFMQDTVEIYVVNETKNHKEVITIGENGESLHCNAIEKGTKMNPFLVVDTDFFNDFAKAVLVYTEDNNIKSERQTFLEGELIATKKHLADLQLYIKKLFSKK